MKNVESRSWNQFEKLAAAIRIAERRGASVEWNVESEGYGFDAALQLPYGCDNYVVVVNCYDNADPVTVAQVLIFDAEAQAVGAHMAVMACATGYTQEAYELTGKCRVRLLNPEVMDRTPEEKLADVFALTLHFYDFRFMQEDGRIETAIPEEPELLSYLMRELKVKGPDIDTFPEQLIDDVKAKLRSSATAAPQRHRIPLSRGTIIVHPNTGAETRVTSFSFTYWLLAVHNLKTEGGFEKLAEDRYLIGSTLKEELAKKNATADPSRIEAGFDTTLEPGKYYYNPRFRFSYFCEAVRRGLATIVLVESRQTDQLVQARVKIRTNLAGQFVEITNRNEVERLTKMYERFAVSDKNLEGRFKFFAKNLGGAECIDDLELTREQELAKKADYFFENRKFIVELKSLQTDSSEKIENILAPHRERPEFPVFFGEIEVHKVLQYLPDKEEINKKISDALTDSVEGVVEEANRQIRETKRTFALPDAGGLLIILNDAVDVLSPDLVVYRVRRALNKKTASDETRFPHVAAVMLINSAHYTQMTPTLKGLPILIIPGAQLDSEKVANFASSLSPRWSAFEGQPFFSIAPEDIPKLNYQRFSDDVEDRPGSMIKRQDLWSLQYKQNPYLRPMDKESFLLYGAKVFERLSTSMIKGGPRIPVEERHELMERFSHVMDEMGFRGIDMREMIAKTDGMNRRMDKMYRQYLKDNPQPKSETRAKQQRQSKAHKNKIGRGAPCICRSGKTYSKCCGQRHKTV